MTATEHNDQYIITIRGLETRFGPVVIHDNLDLDVIRGEVLGVVGGSGTGKSVLMRQIIMLSRPAKGSVKVFGQELVRIKPDDADRVRKRFGVMFQQGALFSSLTVRQNVELVLKEHTNLNKRGRQEVANLKIALSGLHGEAGDKYPRQLSGGMLKRAAVARALALDPELLFLDEPSAGLDPVSAASLDELIIQLSESLGLTVFMVTHDLDSLWRTTNRVAFLGEKHILEIGSMKALSESTHPLIVKYFQGPRGRASKEHAWTRS